MTYVSGILLMDININIFFEKTKYVVFQVFKTIYLSIYINQHIKIINIFK